MAVVNFKRIEDSANINNIDIEDGAFIVTGDGKTFVDYGTDRVATSGTPDLQMSGTSRNTVENRVIKQYVDTLDSKVSSVVSTDANGWTIIEHDNYIEYFKSGEQTLSIAGSFWTRFKVSNLPVGFANLQNTFLTGSVISSDGAINSSLGSPKSYDGIYIQYQNAYNSTVTNTFSWDARILKLKNNT